MYQSELQYNIYSKSVCESVSFRLCLSAKGRASASARNWKERKRKRKVRAHPHPVGCETFSSRLIQFSRSRERERLRSDSALIRAITSATEPTDV